MEVLSTSSLPDSKTLSTDIQFWERWTTWLVLSIVSMTPFFFVSIPPLVDLPGHMGRYHIMAHLPQSEYLRRYYDFHWTAIGNLGVDVLVYVLQPVFGVVRATWMVTAAIPILTTLGLAHLSQVVHGRIQPTAFLALPFIYSHVFLFGFVNYFFSIAIALHACALWIKLSERSLLIRFIVFSPIFCLLWLFHAGGWGFLGVMVAGYDLHRGFRKNGYRVPTLLTALMPLALIALPSVLLMAFSRSAQGHIGIAYNQNWMSIKILNIAGALRYNSMIIDLGIVLVTITVWIVLFYHYRRLSQALALSLLMLIITFCVMPPTLFNSYGADVRLIAPIAMIGMVSLTIPGDRARLAYAIAYIGLTTTAIRIAHISIDWSQVDRQIRANLTALKSVPLGSRIVALVIMPCTKTWNVEQYTRHLPNLAIIYRDAFVNTQWATPGTTTLSILYNTDTGFYQNGTQFVESDHCTTQVYPSLTKAYTLIPRHRFDFLWVINTDKSSTIAHPPSPFSQLYQDKQSALFRIAEPPRQP